MNRLETRMKRLEEVGGTDTGEHLLGVTRVLLDQNGEEMGRSFLTAPIAPMHIPHPHDPDTVEPELQTLTAYRDEPWRLTGQEFRDLLKVISGKTRSI